MPMFINFRVLACTSYTDPLNTITTDYGVHTLVVCQSLGHRLSTKTYNLNTEIPNVSNFTSEPNGALDGLIVAGHTTKLFEPTLTIFMMRAPLASIKRLPTTSGYLVLYNENGLWLYKAYTYGGASGLGTMRMMSADNQFQEYSSLIPYHYMAYETEQEYSAQLSVGSIIAQYDNDVISTLDYIIGGRTGNSSITPQISVNKVTYNNTATSDYMRTIDFLNACKHGLPPTPPSDDPYDDIPDSGPGSGDGSFDFNDTDPIDFGSLPALSAVSTGFISLWCPNNTQINKLSSFMWNASGSVINFLKNLIADPLDLIMGLHIVPLEVTPVGTDTVTVGLINTGVEMDYIESQWAVVDCGTININETWGAYLDYDPYTKMEIYLPYCGTHPLRVDDFMTGTMQVLYNVDLMSGACVAMIKNADSVLYTFMGQCATDIPVTAEQYGNIFKSITQLGANIGETAASGPVAIPGAVSSAVDTVMGLKPSIGRSGAIGGAAGIMSPQKPYIILTRPRQAHPENQNVYMGYPSIYTADLSDLSGYTVIEHIHLEGIGGTQSELNELENILHTGVIF